MDPKVMADTIWTLITAMLVFFMNMGFACVESGFQQSKNCVNVLSKNFIVFAVSTVSFWFVGWGLMFGDGNPFAGLQGLFFIGGADNSPATGDAYQGVYSSIAWTGIPLEAKFFFQLVFAGTAATIVSGAVGGRIKYLSFILFSFLLVALVYPITGHWIWGGGWLAQLGMWDFAGSTVVHSIGGWAALAGALILGPRFGKYNPDGSMHAFPGHNMGLATIGGFVLWLGWFGFNPGSTMAADPTAISHICNTTNMAAATGIIGSTIASWLLLKKPDLGMTINGCLAGLVAITAPCAFVSVGSAAIIGFIAGWIVVFGVLLLDKIRIDDPVGAVPVHLFNGIWGTLAIGLLAQDQFTPGTTGNGLFFGGGVARLQAQAIGVAAAGVYAFIAAAIFWLIIKYTVGMRVSLSEELEGLDIGEHGNAAYPDFVQRKFIYAVAAKASESNNYSSAGPKKTEREAAYR